MSWVCVFKSSKVYEARLVISVLETHGIKAFEINKQDSNYLFGTIEVYADRENVVKALHIINEEIDFK